MIENNFAKWEVIARGCSDGVFGKPLGVDGSQGSFESRYGAFSQERGRLCWDSVGKSLVKVVDWEKTEYWGERVLIVGQIAPRHARGLRWSARQSRLTELAEPLQKLGLERWLLDCDDNFSEEICNWFSSAWQAAKQADEIHAAVEEGGLLKKPKSL